MMETNSVLSNRSGGSMTADQIASSFGYADSAAMIAAIEAGGTSILSGTAVPTTEGNNGDFYLRTTNTQFYGPKTAGIWGAGVSLIGATGATGATGAAGATGATGPAGPAPSGTGLVQVAGGVASTLGLGTALHGVRVNAAGTAYETAAISATDSTKLALDGSNAMTERLQFSGTGTSAGAAIASIYRDSTGDLNYNVDASDVHDFLVNATSQATIGATGIVFPTAHSTMSTSAFGVWRTALTAFLQGPTGTGYAQIGAGTSISAPRMYVSGTTTGYNSGGTVAEGAATSVANAAKKTVLTGATAYSGFAEVVDTTNSRVALYSINAGVPTKESGHSQFVAGAPGAGEVGLELSSTTLRINNGSGGSLLLGCHLRVF